MPCTHTKTGLTNGTAYDFRVRARNAEGWGPWSDTATATPVTVPRKVTGLKLTRRNGDIKADWKAPEDGGSAITGYDVEYRTSPSGTWTDASDSGTDTTHTKSGLTDGTAYDFRVRAVNAEGDGPWSDIATAQPVTVPRKVTGLELTGRNGDIKADWKAPEDGGSAITGYDVQYRESSATTWSDVSHTGTDTTVTQESLTNYTDYDFQVRAVNAEGDGPWSDIATAQPVESPSTPSITAKGYDATIVVMFTPGSSGGPPTHYEVCWEASGVSTECETVRGTGFAIDSVTNGTEYSVRGKAHNGAGSSSYSSDVTATPVAATPGNAPQPRSVKVQPGNTKVMLEWEPGMVHSGADETNHYEVRHGAAEGTGTWADVGEELSEEINSLTNGTNYWFHVRACAGESLGTRCSGAVSVRGEPTATPLPWRVGGMNGEGIAVESGQKSLKVTWPSATYADSYEIRYGTYELGFNGAWMATANADSHNLRELTNGERYMIKIRGVNTAGSGPESSWVMGVPESSAPQQFRSAPPPGKKVSGEIIGLSWQPGPGMSPGSYELQSVQASDSWQVAQSKTVTGTSTQLSGLTPETAYNLRVRSVYHEDIPGGWSETLSVTPGDTKAVLTQPFADLSLANDATHEIDLSGHFSGAGLSYAVSVTTTHKKTGKVKTGPLNSVARNKITGSLDGAALTLTAGPEGEHVLGMKVTATDAEGGTASGSFELTVAPDPATLIQPLEDLSLANGEAHDLDLSQHFSGTGLTWQVMVTTTHKKTGKVRTGPINTLARNKIHGSFSSAVLTLTAGAQGDHVLGMEVIATDADDGTASDSFELTVGAEPDSDSLASEALQNALAHQARQLLEDTSAVIGNRMVDASTGSDALTALAGLFGQQGPGGCPLGESIEDCVTRGSAGGGIAALFNPQGGFGAGSDPFSLAPQSSGFNAQDQSFGFAELRERAKHGFAISLNQPLPQPGAQFTQDMAPPQNDMQLTLWGQAAPGLSQGTMFWGMDAQRSGRWITGLAFSESTGSTISALSRGNGRVSGFAESEVTAVYPYARGRIASGLDVWSLAGWGQGRLASRWADQSDVSGPEEAIDLHGGLAFSMGLAGAEQRLYEHGGFSVSAVGDAGWSRLAVSGGTADGVAASVHRTRAAVEGRWLSDTWSSNLRVGGRVDGGDGETASGAELSGDVLHSWGRWEAGLQGRWYSANTAEASAGGFGDQGVRAALGLRSAADGTGLAFTLSPGWGTAGLSHAAGAVQGAGLLDTLPGNMAAAGVAGDAAAAAASAPHVNGQISWGTGVDGLLRGQEVLRPWAEFSLSSDARQLRTGLALEGPLRTSFALERRESVTGGADHGLIVLLGTRF